MPANTLHCIGGQIPKKTNMPANAFCIGGHISVPRYKVLVHNNVGKYFKYGNRNYAEYFFKGIIQYSNTFYSKSIQNTFINRTGLKYFNYSN